MKFRLEPQALIPWKLMDTRVLKQDLGAIDLDYMTLMHDEGFEWCDVVLPADKTLRLMKLLELPDLDARLELLFKAAALEANLSRCLRVHLGVALANEDLGSILAVGHNLKPAYFSDCDTLGCDLNQPCRAAYSGEQIAFIRLKPELPPPYALVSRTPPNLDGIDLCELNGVKVVIYLEHRNFVRYDIPFISLKTVESSIIFLRAYLRDDE